MRALVIVLATALVCLASDTTAQLREAPDRKYQSPPILPEKSEPVSDPQPRSNIIPDYTKPEATRFIGGGGYGLPSISEPKSPVEAAKSVAPAYGSEKPQKPAATNLNLRSGDTTGTSPVVAPTYTTKGKIFENELNLKTPTQLTEMSKAEQRTQEKKPLDRTNEINLAIGVLVFFFLVIAFEIWVILQKKEGWGTESIRIVGLTLILAAALFLVTAGYSETQIAPVIGLLGAIAGYLLGKNDLSKK